ncbi:flagellar hook-length control protein FliK [Vibrio pectenicida]|uniref:Flagellar hook-length control protein FliK n=1 Tax=Vibrio pectenicida TaxID=62763 RepID=A0A7Y4A293_9VIBR|nr:flagellar hook-length control protein FliK [Vibrio pectenicida]NOH73332.1 flagellar hook-length control protein FliK [Vibrio pectenicida]
MQTSSLAMPSKLQSSQLQSSSEQASGPQASAGQGSVQKARTTGEAQSPSTRFSLVQAKVTKPEVQADAQDSVAELPDAHQMLALPYTQSFGSKNEALNLKSVSSGIEAGFQPSMSAKGQTHLTLSQQSSPTHILTNIAASSKVATASTTPIESAAPITMTALQNGLSATPIQTQAQPSNNLEASSPTAQWAVIKVDTSAAKWGEQMMQVLHDRVSVQAQQNLQQAQIRLDPPELGKMDLLVRVEGDKLSVQIHANSSATREALMQVSDRLRAELQNHNFLHVDVNVGSGDTPQGQSNRSDEQHAVIFDSNEHPDNQLSLSPSEHWLSTHA